LGTFGLFRVRPTYQAQGGCYAIFTTRGNEASTHASALPGLGSGLRDGVLFIESFKTTYCILTK
jgi:hypothetical protein